MFTNIRKGQMWLDRMNDKCMHYHDMDKKWIESPLEKHVYSRGLGRSINMRPSYPNKTHYVTKATFLRHQWCGLGFRHYLFQGTSHPNICPYGTSVVGWLCLDHSSGLVEWIRFFYQYIHNFLLLFGLFINNKLLTGGGAHSSHIYV